MTKARKHAGCPDADVQYGPVANHVGYPPGNPDAVLPTLRGDLKRAAEVELKLVRGEQVDVRAYYESIAKDGPYFTLCARLAILGATDRADFALFDRVWRDLDAYAAQKNGPRAALAVELVKTSVRLRLRMANGYPDWLTRFEFSALPTEWYAHAAYLGVKVLMEQRQYAQALGAIGILRAVNDRHDHVEAADGWLKLLAAVCCRELHRYDEMNRWFRLAAEVAAGFGSIMPFLEFSLGEGGSLEASLAAVSPELCTRVRLHVDSFYLNTIRTRNHFTGGHITEKLTRRQFYIARHIHDGNSYKEIAEMLNLSVGRVRNIVSDIYAILGIKGKSELDGLVW